jgi:transglutaminase-like putative cysteine protease
MKQYLLSTKYINWEDPEVTSKAKELSRNLATNEAVAESCFTFVRDEIKHSHDFQLNPVTVKASAVLHHKTGYCYAKSHLLAALLRANQIPAGLCYQRLTIENNKPPFCLHGLNAIFLEKYGWYRVDARGNKQNVNARFIPPKEQLAFPIIAEGECDIQGIWPEPLSLVIEVLENSSTCLEVHKNLPDIEIIKG